MRVFFYIIMPLFFCFCSCKKENHKPKNKSLEKIEKPQRKENYKVCLNEVFLNNIRLGNYGHTIRITPDTSRPKNDMAYKLLLIRDKKMANVGNLKLNDTVVDMLIHKKAIKALYEQNKNDTINIDNFHLLRAGYNYSRASETHFEVLLYSIKDSLFCGAGYHFDYVDGTYRFGIYKKQNTKIEAFEDYNSFKCY